MSSENIRWHSGSVSSLLIKTLTGVVAFSLTLATLQPAHADEPATADGDLSASASVSETELSLQSYEAALDSEHSADAAYTPDNPAADVSVYLNESGTATATAPLGGSDSITVSLPGETASSTSGSGDLTLFETNSSYETAVENAGDWAFRALVRIESASAPKDYPFDLVVPENSELISLEDGGVVLRGPDGSMLGSFASPWAKDAAGTAVPTEFLIENNRLIQRVHFSANSALPVVADPFWLPVLFILAHVTRHAAMQAASRGVSQALIHQVIRNGAKSAGNKGTSVFTQGSGTSRIRVIVDNRTGNIITVTKG